jgi:hypothetical protein
LEHFPDSHLSGICIVYFPDIFLTFFGHLFFIGRKKYQTLDFFFLIRNVHFFIKHR